MPRQAIYPRSIIEDILISLQLSSRTISELSRDTGYSTEVLRKYLDVLEFLHLVYYDTKTHKWCLRKPDNSLVRRICSEAIREFLGEDPPQVLKEITLQDLIRIIEFAIIKAWRWTECSQR